MDRRKGKGKISEAGYYNNKSKQEEAEWKKLQARVHRECEHKSFVDKMKIFKSREERKGKDWVKTKEEMYNFNYYNDDLMNEFVAGRKKLDADLKNKKISEEGWYSLVEELSNRIEQKYEELLDAEEAEMEKYVQEYEARERQMEARAAKAREARAAKEREAEEEDENYAVNLSDF